MAAAPRRLGMPARLRMAPSLARGARRPVVERVPAPLPEPPAPSIVPPANGLDGCIAVGQVMGAFGPRGDVRVQPFSDHPERFKAIKRLFIGDALVPARILGRGVHGLGITLRLDGITTREHAKGLFGSLLYVPEGEAVTLPPGEYFVHLLIGSGVVTDEGEHLGTVTEILRTGSNDVYVIAGPRGEVLVPVIPDVVKRVDLEARTIHVTLMPGLID